MSIKNKIICEVCFHRCALAEGQIGFCGARKNIAGTVKPINYGKLTSIALDPIEKKPLYHFAPRSLVLSLGSFGCNFKCPFCQNAEISMASEQNTQIIYHTTSGKRLIHFRTFTPEKILKIAKMYQPYGNIGVAYTYNEPLVGYEFVRDTAELIHAEGLKNVLVTNGSANLAILEGILPFMDAMNIDLKGFSESFYRDFLKGDFENVKNFIRLASEHCHIEITTLIIPDKNDSTSEMEKIARFISSLKNGQNIPLHINRFFPAYKFTDCEPTSKKTLYTLAEIARQKLNYVYLGNV